MSITSPVGPYALNPGLAADPIVAIASPRANQIVNKGNSWVHTQTKSTVNKPTVYCNEDACGNKYYKKANVSASTNKLVDCELVPEFSGSISVTVPFNATQQEITAFLTQLAEQIAVAAVNYTCA